MLRSTPFFIKTGVPCSSQCLFSRVKRLKIPEKNYLGHIVNEHDCVHKVLRYSPKMAQYRAERGNLNCMLMNTDVLTLTNELLFIYVSNCKTSHCRMPHLDDENLSLAILWNSTTAQWTVCNGLTRRINACILKPRNIFHVLWQLKIRIMSATPSTNWKNSHTYGPRFV